MGRARNQRRIAALLTAAVTAALTAITALAALLPLEPADAAADCSTTDSGSGYTVTVCLAVTDLAGTPESAITGRANVTATVTTSALPSGRRVQGVVFCRDDGACSNRASGYLITDWSGTAAGGGAKDYGFVLDSRLYADGSTSSLRASVEMNDGTTASSPSYAVSFVNGQAAPPPVPTGFKPYVPSASGPLTFAAVGDGAGGEPFERDVTSMIGGWRPALHLYLGDVYDKGTPEEFDNWYDKYGYGDLKAITNPVIGNHEYSGDPRAEGYNRYWRTPPHYYSYDAGGWHFVALDSNSQFATSVPGVDQDAPSTVEGVTTQYDWLKADLQAHAGSCTVVSYHHPRWSQGEMEESTRMDKIWSLMVDQHVSLVLNGHEHDYQRLPAMDGSGVPSATGPTEFVIGAGGHSTQQVTPGSQPGPDPVVYTSAFSATRFTVRPDRVDFRTASPDGTTDGKLVDQGSVPCQGRGRDTTAPTAPTVTATTRVLQNLPVVDLTWTGAKDDRGVASYDVLRDGVVVAKDLPSTSTTWSDETVQSDSSYRYQVRAKDVWGNDATSSQVTVTTPTPSSAPVSAPLLADTYVANTSPTPKGTADRVRVLEDGTRTNLTYLKFDLSRISGTIASATLRITPAAGTAAGSTAYSVADTSWSESKLGWPGPELGAAGGRTTSPLVAGTPQDVDVTGLVAPGGVATLGLKETSGTSAQAFYSKEAAGFPAPQLLVTLKVAPDVQAPTVPSAVRAVATTETEVDVTWGASSDDRSVDHYVVYRDGQVYDSVASTSTGYTDVEVAAGQRFSYAVSAVDHAGNESARSATATVTVPDLTSPVELDPPVAVATSSTSAMVTWDEAEDNVAVAGYRVYRDKAVVAVLPATAESWTDTSLKAAKSYTYGIQAFDAAGNSSAVRWAPPVTTPGRSSDTSPPTVPGGLQAQATTGTSVSLSWQASSDDQGVASYTVFRDGSPVAHTTTPGLVDVSVSPARSYAYAVDAVDAAGNHSARTPEVSVTTPDDVPPSTPASLSVSADSYRSVGLSWTAAADNVGTAAYVVSRDGTTLGETTTTTYTDTSAPADTDVTYRVRARDAAGNLSAPVVQTFHTPAPRTADSGWVDVADSAYVQSGTSSSTNYKYATTLKVSGGTTPKVTYLKLTVPTGVLPVLDHLYLQLTTTTTSGGFAVRRVAANGWDRATITWDSKPAWDTSTVATSGAIASTGTVPTPPGTIDLAPMINGPGTYSVALTADASTGQSYASSYSTVPVAERPKVRWISHD